MNRQTQLHFLRFSAALMFFGRFWEHFRWLGPYRDVFYYPKGFFMATVQFFTNETVTEIYNNHFYENLVIYFSKGLGIVFLFAGIIILFYEKLKQLKWFVYLALFGLLFCYWGILMGKHFEMWGIFFEHMAQLAAPVLFLQFYTQNSYRITYLAQIAISITFISHGLFAVGYYPQPGYFADMMIVGFRLTEHTARLLLIIVGWLDFLFGIVILIPFWRLTQRWTRKIFLAFVWYGIIWGFLTALARFYVPYNTDFFWNVLSQDFYKVLIRVPHFTLPLFILGCWRAENNERKLSS